MDDKMNAKRIVALGEEANKFIRNIDKVEALENKISDILDKTKEADYYANDLQNLYEALTTLREAMQDVDNAISNIHSSVEEDEDNL
jgi:uncharacterized protein YoxC